MRRRRAPLLPSFLCRGAVLQQQSDGVAGGCAVLEVQKERPVRLQGFISRQQQQQQLPLLLLLLLLLEIPLRPLLHHCFISSVSSSAGL